MLRRAVRAFGAAAIGCAAASLLLVVAMQAIVGRWSWHNTADTAAALSVVSVAALLLSVPALLVFGRGLRQSGLVAATAVAALVAGAVAAALVAWFLATEDHSPVTLADWLRALALPCAPAVLAGAVFGLVWLSRHDESRATL